MPNKRRKNLPPRMVMPRYIQYISKTIAFFSTNLAVKFAYKLFVTPIKFRVPKREHTMRENIQKKRKLITSLNKRIDVFTYGKSEKKVLLVHGWSGRGTQFFMLADKLLENGYMVVGFDAPAHSNSEGSTTNLLEFIEVVKQLHTDFNGFDSAIGHSLGGVTLYNTANFLNLSNFVTVGSSNTISEIISLFVRNLGMKPEIAPKLKTYIEKKTNEDDIDLYSADLNAKKIMSNVLIVHDTDDTDVEVHSAYDIDNNLNHSKLLITKNLGHTKILRDEDTANKIVQFIKENS